MACGLSATDSSKKFRAECEQKPVVTLSGNFCRVGIDPTNLVLGFLCAPHITAQISKGFATLTSITSDAVYQLLVNAYTRDPVLKIYLRECAPDLYSEALIKAVHALVLARLKQCGCTTPGIPNALDPCRLSKFAEAADFVAFFRGVSRQLPSAKAILERTEGDLCVRAAALKNWSEINGSAMQQIRDLVLRNVGMRQLPAQIGLLTGLKFLYLEANMLTDLPKEIWLLKRLELLHLAQNRLTSISRRLGELTQLLCLQLNKNQLTYLPDEIGSLSLLSLLNLRENHILELPSSLHKLPQLNDILQ